MKMLAEHPRLGRPDSSYPIAGVRRFVMSDYVIYFAPADKTGDI